MDHTVSLPRFWPLLLIAAVIRLGVVSLGVALATLPPDLRPPGDTASAQMREEIDAGTARVIEPWYRWDAGWYVDLAKNGYGNADSADRHLRVAFLPALPLCMAAARFLQMNPFWAGLLIVNIAASIASVVFARVAARLTGDYSTGIRAFLLLQAYPASLFLSAPYNEALGLLFATVALQAWLNRQAVRAGVFAGLCSLSRLTGVSLGVAGLGGWLCDDRDRKGLGRAVGMVLGSFLGLLIFWAYLGWVVGDPLAGIKVQEFWGRKHFSLANPLYCVAEMGDRAATRHGEAFAGLGFAVEGITALAFTLLGVRAWIKRGAFWGLATLVPVAQLVMSGSFMSSHRLLLAALPAFMELADLLRRPVAFSLLFTVFICSQLMLLNRFVHWQFAG